MKPILLFFLVAGAAAPLRAAGPARPGDSAAPPNLFALIGPDYKKLVELPDSFFNPFKVEATTELTQAKKGALATGQTVVDAIGRRGVSGIVYLAGPDESRVIIGDQVFRAGDELQFPDANGVLSPLIVGASVILRQVGKDDLVFDLVPDGEPARRTAFSLRDFWRR